MPAQPDKKSKKALRAEALTRQNAEIAALEQQVFGDIPEPDFPGALASSEIWWRDHYQWLKGRGYLLRPRYAPDWVPSWQGTKKSFDDSEDGRNLRVCPMVLWDSIVNLDMTPCSSVSSLMQLASRMALL